MLKKIICFLTFALFLTPLTALGFSADIFEQFPQNTNGENGFWAQGCIVSSLTFYNLTYKSDYIFGNNGGLPLVQKNESYGQKEIMLHPTSLPFTDAVLTWDVPDDKPGRYHITGQFRLPNIVYDNSDGVKVYILKNDWTTIIFSDESTLVPTNLQPYPENPYTTSPTYFLSVSFDKYVDLTEGTDLIHFVVDPNNSSFAPLHGEELIESIGDNVQIRPKSGVWITKIGQGV
jgi:hypothetical protein